MPDPAAASVRRRRERLALALYALALALAAALFSLAPGIDLWASGLFYHPGTGFFLGTWWPVHAIYAGIPYVTKTVAVGVPLLLLLGLLRRRPIWRIDGRTAAFLLLSLALGPGLLVNAVLKDHWGRARPAQVTEFGGTQHFTPPLLPADQCARNCSFPAGHPAIGFYFVSFAFLVPAPGRRRLALGTALAAGALAGAGRMAQGGHFLSDVVFAGFLVCGTSWLLYRALLASDALGALGRAIGHPPRWFAPAALALLAIVLLSIAVIDRPVAWFFHASDPEVAAVFQFITQFGIGRGYLIVSAVLFAVLAVAARLTKGRAVARQLAINAYRALFIFLVVAISGLLTDLLKVMIGRARPKLLFAGDLYGFAWGATQADHWSMPSGHATTIAALATAFFLLWPRGLPAYLLAALLVMASRVVIGAHFVSDVMAGAALGALVAWAVWRVLPRLGLALEAPVPRPAAAGVSDNRESRGASTPGSGAPSRGRAE